MPTLRALLRSIAALSVFVLALKANAAPSPGAPPSTPPAPAPLDKRAEARAHFEKGRELLLAKAWAEALAEFAESRRLYPTWSATSSAAVCLEKLKRLDEALEMFEALLREFGSTLTADVKEAAEREEKDLKGHVGAIEITGAQPGATLLIDSRDRGTTPPPGLLRVGEGSHMVRVYLAGFAPFEATFDVAAQKTVTLAVQLRPLLQAGRLRVVEPSGKVLDVVVDGIVVGVTPWEGPIAIGEHTVMLRGQESLGTLPRPVSIRLSQQAELTLAAEELDASLRVAPAPATASVEVDGVFVGRGIWDGRLHPGAHRVRVIADGFLPKLVPVKLERGTLGALSVVLDRDPRSPIWRLPARFTFELSGALPLVPSFGGGVAGGCAGECQRSVGVGGEVAFHGGYELWNGFGFGVAAGYLSLRQTTQGRATAIKTVGHDMDDRGLADDVLKLRGFFAGGWAALKVGERFPLRSRLGVGAVIGSVSDTRTGSFRVIDPSVTESYKVGPVIEAPSAAWLYVDPEVRAGVRLGEHFEVSAGFELLLLVSPRPPAWDAKHPINASSDGYGEFRADALISPIIAVLTPGVSARYDF